ncbi:SDR family oxidoreductase [Phenylobacterium sp.]|jgi:NAD(P)-dependent dehydrogenase (short-subunit alcohol dehydrogenase family)|uniref:SDR family oxidoreductase n=1 Tax=Phenylobacterium sp. TaxID=1871053 RepID=UPI003783A1A5
MRRVYAVVVLAAALMIAGAAQAATVLVTGANRGIGLALATHYSEQGWTVIATARSPDGAPELAALAAKHKAVVVERLDVTDLAGIRALAARYQGRPIDVVINNAGVMGNTDHQQLGGFDRETFHTMLDVNTFGPLAVTEAFLENVRASDQKKVVTITSVESSMVRAPRAFGMLFYKISKAAVNMSMQELKAEPRGKGIVFAMIAPGFVETDLADELRASPLGRGRNIPQGIPPARSAAGIARVIDGLTLENAKVIYNYDGSTIPF